MTRTINHWIDSKSVASGLEPFKGWSMTPLLRHARVLFKFRELIETNR